MNLADLCRVVDCRAFSKPELLLTCDLLSLGLIFVAVKLNFYNWLTIQLHHFYAIMPYFHLCNFCVDKTGMKLDNWMKLSGGWTVQAVKQCLTQCKFIPDSSVLNALEMLHENCSGYIYCWHWQRNCQRIWDNALCDTLMPCIVQVTCAGYWDAVKHIFLHASNFCK